MAVLSDSTSIILQPRSLPNWRVPILTTGTPINEHSRIPMLELPIRHLLLYTNLKKSSGTMLSKKCTWLISWFSLKYRMLAASASVPASALES